MTGSSVKLGFFKLSVANLEEALEFWRSAFGFETVASFDEEHFCEQVLALPGQECGPNLMLVQWKTPREVSMGSAHGPVGLVCEDIRLSLEHAKAAGAAVELDVFDAGGVLVAMMRAPQGHEIELVQFAG